MFVRTNTLRTSTAFFLTEILLVYTIWKLENTGNKNQVFADV